MAIAVIKEMQEKVFDLEKTHSVCMCYIATSYMYI